MKRFLQLLTCIVLALGVVAMVLAWMMYVLDGREEDAIQVVPFSQSSSE